jgi:hemoglobin
MAEPTLYERLGGIFAIAAVVDHFSNQLLKNPKVVEANPELNEWHTAKYPGRLPGLKFLRTLWVASLAGGPFQYTARELRDAHFDLKIAPEVFDEVSGELGRTLGHFNVPAGEEEARHLGAEHRGLQPGPRRAVCRAAAVGGPAGRTEDLEESKLSGAVLPQLAGRLKDAVTGGEEATDRHTPADTRRAWWSRNLAKEFRPASVAAVPRSAARLGVI